MIDHRDSRVKSLSEFAKFQQSFRTRLNQSSENSIEPEQILVELPHSSYSEDSWHAEKSSGPQNLTLFTLFVGGNTMVFIGGVRRCCGQRLGVWGPLVKPVGQATWSCNQVSSLHYLWALDTLSTASTRHVDKMIFGNAPTYGLSAKVI
jgi:hypothetical protein